MAKKEVFLYKEAIKEIEEIMYQLENEEIDLDELSNKVKRASDLIAKCKNKLKNTEDEIENIIKKVDGKE